MKEDYIYQLTEKTEEFLPNLLFAVGFKGVYLKKREDDGEDDSFITYGIANDTLLQFSCDATVNSEIRNYFARRCFTTASNSSLGYDTHFCDLLWQRYQESVKELHRYKNREILQRYESRNKYEYSDKLELFDHLITNGVAWSVDRLLETASKFPPLTKQRLISKTRSNTRQEDDNPEKGEIISIKSIKNLHLSPKTHAALVRDCHIFSVSKLIRHTEQELRAYRNIGDKSIEELKGKLKKYGLSLAESNTMQ